MRRTNEEFRAEVFRRKEEIMKKRRKNIKNMHSEEVAQKLGEYDIAVRAGLHCAPIIHKKNKTNA